MRYGRPDCPWRRQLFPGCNRLPDYRRSQSPGAGYQLPEHKYQVAFLWLAGDDRRGPAPVQKKALPAGYWFVRGDNCTGHHKAVSPWLPADRAPSHTKRQKSCGCSSQWKEAIPAMSIVAAGDRMLKRSKPRSVKRLRRVGEAPAWDAKLLA